MSGSDVHLSDMEQRFGNTDDQIRFARFCNTVIVAETKGPVPSLPRLDDSPGADGGFDGSWTLPDVPTAGNAARFAVPGWNAFQFKARNNAGGPARAFQSLKQSVRGAVQQLVSRAGRPGELRRYTLFTNLRLGRPEKSTTARNPLPSRRDELTAAIREGLPVSGSIQVEVLDGAYLQAVVNAHPAIRETFFGVTLFQTWDDSWRLLVSQNLGQPLAPLVGRAKEFQQMRDKLHDPTVGFIGISGASGIGKSRLLLEATKDFATNTLFVRTGAKAAFLAKNLEAYATASRWVFVIEDLRFEEAKPLAEQAILHPGICIVATIPAEEHLPRLGLGDSPAIFSLRVPPLESNNARELLKTIGAKLDYDLAEWVIQEAGGNPQIILAAAELGPDLRQKVGWLKRQVAQKFLDKAEKLLGADVVPVLEMLSVLSPFDVRNESHVRAVQRCFDLAVDLSTIRRLRDRLEDAAFLECSGRLRHELNVSPPLLAAFLVDRLLDGQPQRSLALYGMLDDNGRRRLFDRLVSVESSAEHGLWAHVFGPNGPFAGEKGIERNIDSLQILSRAAPRQTVEFLSRRNREIMALLGHRKVKLPRNLTALLLDQSRQSERNRKIDEFRSNMMGILHELIDHTDSSRVALGVLEKIATADRDLGSGFQKLFTECFVAWYYRFPVPPAERWEIVSRLTKSTRPKERMVGFSALFEITDPPFSLSGQGVYRRRIGEQVPALTMRDFWDYHCLAFDLHLTTATTRGPFRMLATEHMRGALAELRRLPPARVMPLLRRVERAFWRKKLKLAPAQLLSCLTDAKERFAEALVRNVGAEWAAEIPKYVHELSHMITRVEDGPLPLRLQLWIDSHPTFGWKAVPGTDRHRYEMELEKLAADFASRPAEFTPELLAMLISERATHSADFANFLGRADKTKAFWRGIADLQKRPGGAWVFGSYCDGVAEHDSAFVESQLDRAMPTAGGDMLVILKRLGPTVANRRRVLRLIRQKQVTSIELAHMFQTGRWLDQLPVAEVRTLLSYIVRDRTPVATYNLLQVLSLYRHRTEKIPRLLLSIAQSVLQRRSQTQQDTDFDCDHLAERIAKTDLKTGLRLFGQLMDHATTAKWEYRCWNPVNGYTSSLDFYRYVTERRPTVAYAAVLRYLASKNRFDVLNQDSVLFDLPHHAPVLLRLTQDDRSRASIMARHLRFEQPGFWDFIYELLGLHPSDARLRHELAKIFADDLPWEYLGGNKIAVTLQKIEAQLALPTVPAHGRVFLGQIKTLLSARREVNAQDEE